MCGKSGDIACTLGLPATALAIICDLPPRGRKPLENRFSNTRTGLALICARRTGAARQIASAAAGWRLGDPARLRRPVLVQQEPGLLLPYSSGHVL